MRVHYYTATSGVSSGPVESTVASKLFDSLEDLRGTAAFLQGTGVSIGAFDKKRKKKNSNYVSV